MYYHLNATQTTVRTPTLHPVLRQHYWIVHTTLKQACLPPFLVSQYVCAQSASVRTVERILRTNNKTNCVERNNNNKTTNANTHTAASPQPEHTENKMLTSITLHEVRKTLLPCVFQPFVAFRMPFALLSSVTEKRALNPIPSVGITIYIYI